MPPRVNSLLGSQSARLAGLLLQTCNRFRSRTRTHGSDLARGHYRRILEILDRHLARGPFRLQDGEKSANFHVMFQRMSQMKSPLKSVMILASHALPLQVAAPFKLDHDSLNGAFGNLHF